MALSLLKSIFGKRTATQSGQTEIAFDAKVIPDIPAYIIGDVHGCYDLLVKKLEAIETDRVQNSVMADAPIVFVGDLVDRGPQSAQVLRLLQNLCSDDPAKTICLFGNHEEMLIDFIDDPAGKGRRWLRFGGAETLASFGMTGVSNKIDLEDLVKISSDFEAALGDELQTWLRALPRVWSSGNLHCVHAGMNPAKPVTSQRSTVLLWGHPAFETTAREDGQWVAHGHTIVAKPTAHSGRIATDTGAYKTGELTAAAVSNDSVRFI